jgi:radical SAM protein with 4Fe4S-binding SPASM domain
MGLDNREIPDSLERVEFADIEDILDRNLTPLFGDRFRQYRQEYRRTLNSEKDGFHPVHPLTVSLELVNRCNLTCVMCYTANHKGQKYTLSLEALRTFFDDCKTNNVPALMLGDHSEPLLYKEIREVIRAAKQAQIMDIFLFTNGVLLTEDLAEFLVTEQVSRVFISLDAVNPDTYKDIRGKDELERIEKNIRTLLDVRRKHGVELPVVRVSFCVQKRNHTEQDAFKEKWAGIVDFIDFQATSDVSWVTELLETGTVNDPALLDVDVKALPFCNQPFGYLSVLSSGDIAPCCNFYAHNLKMGHITKDSIHDIWHGEKMEKLRQELLTGNPNATCRVCLSQRFEDFSDGVREESAKVKDKAKADAAKG